MTFLPVVERELRVAARRRGTYWNRLGVALVGLIIGGWIMLFPHLRSPQILGIVLFVALAVVSFLYSALAGVLSTADSLSEEKREGTLGLLFLTDLKGYDIVFGKLTAKSLNTFYGMLAIFPVMAIPLMVGGVTGSEFWRVMLVCVNNLFFSMALGMFCSSISRDERKAMVLAVSLLLLFAAGLPLLGAIVGEWREKTLTLLFFIPSPSYACFLAFDETFRGVGKWNFFYSSVVTIHILSWLLLVFSIVIVPRTWQEKATGASAGRSGSRWRQWLRGSPDSNTNARRRMLGFNAFFWLAGRDRVKSILVWGLLGIGTLIYSWGIWLNSRDWLDEPAYVMTALAAHTLLKLWVTFEACRQLAGDQKSGALELLLVTPIRVREILRGQLLALLKQFGGPVLVILIADFLFWTSNANDWSWNVYWLVSVAVFVVDLITLAWVGMWQSLNSRNTNRAVAATIVRILVLPWVLFALTLTFFALVMTVPRSWINSEITVMLIAGAIAMGVNILFGWSARHRLLSGFRTAVAEPRRKRRA